MADNSSTRVKDYGRGNKVISTGPDPASVPVEFSEKAVNCTVEIGKGSKFQSGKIRMRGPNGRVVLGDWVALNAYMFVGTDSLIQMGTRAWVGPGTEMSAAEGASVIIGGQTLIGANAIIRADDSHPFFDRATGQRLNKAQTVNLEEHVWLGRDVAVLPGSVIGTGSVVGTRSTITKGHPVPSNSVVVGTPARVVRSNIEWLYMHVQMDDVPESIEPSIGEPSVVDLISSAATKSPSHRFLRRLTGR
jgi:acetyltransferase-like isoleucine patch superfamily enzyme